MKPSNWRGLIVRGAKAKVVGVVVMLYGFGIMPVMINGLHWNKVVSYVVQAVTSVLLSFLLNRYWTWRDREVKLLTGLAKAAPVRIATIAGNSALFWVWVHIGVPYPVAQALNIMVMYVLNFVLNDKIVFRAKPKNGDNQGGGSHG